MLMLADSVESDRLVLLSKAHAAWKVDSFDKASRILQRLRAQTEESGTIATTPAVANGASSTSSSSASSSSASPSQRLMHPVPIVSVASRDSPASSAAPHTRELANGFRVPLLAPALHTPAVTITPSVPLPTARQPPLFLVLHNTALLHLRAGKLKLAQIFLARALEHSESLLSSLAPPSAVPAATSTSPNSSPSHSRLNRLSAEGSTQQPQLLSPPASRPSSSSGAASRPAPPSPLLSPSASSAGSASLPLYSFLLSKSLELFFTTGVVLLQLHASTAEDAARGSSSKQSWADSEAFAGLRLAAQCFRHVLYTAESPAWAVLPPAMAAASSTKFLSARIRFAESLSVLHRCNELAKASSAVHPLLRDEDDDAQEQELGSAAVGILSDDPYSLQHAVPHLRRALMIVQQQQKQQQQKDDKPAATVLGLLAASVSLQLAHVLLSLREAQPALDLLTPMLAQRDIDSLLFSQLIQAELYAAEAFLLLRRSDDALRILMQSRNADVQRVMRACDLIEAASADPVSASGVAESDEAVSLHVCSTLAFILLAQGQADRAQRCIQLGLEARPSHPPLLQLALLQCMRSGEESIMRSLWLLKRRQAAAMPIGTIAVSTAVEAAGMQ